MITTLYRGGGIGSMPRNLTAKDVIDYEVKELGNTIEVTKGVNLDKIPSKSLEWLVPTAKLAGEYGEVTRVFIKDYRVIATDNYGGLLIEVLKGGE